MSDFDIKPSPELLAEAEEFLHTYAAMNATEASLLAEVLIQEYDRRGRIAEAAKAYLKAKALRPIGTAAATEFRALMAAVLQDGDVL